MGVSTVPHRANYVNLHDKFPTRYNILSKRKYLEERDPWRVEIESHGNVAAMWLDVVGSPSWHTKRLRTFLTLIFGINTYMHNQESSLIKLLEKFKYKLDSLVGHYCKITLKLATTKYFIEYQKINKY